MKLYPKYKDSGIEWLGNIPEYWEVRKLNWLCRITTGAKDTENNDPEGEYPFFVRSQIVERINSYSFDGEAILTAGDGAGVAKVFHYYNGKFDFHQRVYMLYNFRNIHGRYLFEYMRNMFGHEVLKLSAKSTVDSLRRPMFQAFPVVVPPFPEQRAIATYLDRETAKIDSLIAKQEQMIALLEEKRQALISHAVTKGIDPNAKMKDSGVEWLGKVPEHWEVLKAKLFLRERDARSTDGSEELLTVSHLTGITPRSEKDVNMIMPESLEDYKICHKGDVVINTMWAWMGAMGCSSIDGIVSPSYNVYRPISANSLHIEFMDSLMRVPAFVTIATSHSKGIWSSRLRLYPESFLQIEFALPPLSEQFSIMESLNAQLTQMEQLRSKALLGIDLLNEKRSALISAVVTGKIDVRGEAEVESISA